jgi:hypothetical protein
MRVVGAPCRVVVLASIVMNAGPCCDSTPKGVRRPVACGSEGGDGRGSGELTRPGSEGEGAAPLEGDRKGEDVCDARDTCDACGGYEVCGGYDVCDRRVDGVLPVLLDGGSEGAHGMRGIGCVPPYGRSAFGGWPPPG